MPLVIVIVLVLVLVLVLDLGTWFGLNGYFNPATESWVTTRTGKTVEDEDDDEDENDRERTF